MAEFHTFLWGNGCLIDSFCHVIFFIILLYNLLIHLFGLEEKIFTNWNQAEINPTKKFDGLMNYLESGERKTQMRWEKTSG